MSYSYKGATLSGIRDQRVHLHIYVRAEPRNNGTKCLPLAAKAIILLHSREQHGSVIDCLSGDRRVAGSSLTSVTVLCP